MLNLRSDIRIDGKVRPKPGPAFLAAALAALGAAAVALEHGFQEDPLPTGILRAGQLVFPWLALAAGGAIAWRGLSRARWRGPIGRIGEALVVLALALEFTAGPLAAEVVAVAAAVTMVVRLNGVLSRTLRSPAVLFPASFLLLITVSASLLKLPAATPTGAPIGWVDALFTATSAVCVTGLTVRDTYAGFTPFGQAVIAGSIQLGGLGMMIFGSTLALLFGARLSFKEHMTLSMALDEYPAHRITRFAWFIVGAMLLLELIGAGYLFFTWPASVVPEGQRLWFSVFHSVSAVCNAGFDLTGSSLIPLREHPAVLVGVAPLIITGGLGFIVLENLYRVGRDRWFRKLPDGDRRPARLTTHTKLVLATTAILLTTGFATIAIAQALGGSQRGLGAVGDAAFMSVTARTAGFTSMPMDELTPGSRFTLMLLMLAGGSPGSTAGGMKTTVIAVLALAVWSTARGRSEVEAFGRALPDALVKKAATVAAGLLGVVALATLVLDMTEEIAFEPLIFEVISAATTTGLSLGATGDLSPAGRVVITITMFMGRVGALALMASIVGGATETGRYRLPRDTVSLG